MKKIIIAACVALSLALPGCGKQSGEDAVAHEPKAEMIHMADFVTKMKGAGLDVSEPKQKLYAMIMASDGAGFDVNGDSLEVYEFNTSIKSGKDALEKLRSEGLGGKAAEIHKNIGLIIHDESENTKKAVALLKAM